MNMHGEETWKGGENMDENKDKEVDEAVELDLDDLDEVSGGSIANARRQKTKDITDDVANRA